MSELEEQQDAYSMASGEQQTGRRRFGRRPDCDTALQVGHGLAEPSDSANIAHGLAQAGQVESDIANLRCSPVSSSGESSSDESDYENDVIRQCWICYGPGDDWRSPCVCIGSSRWVHEECLLRWIDERQKGLAPDAPVACSQCKVEYKLHLPAPTYLEQMLDRVNNLVSRVSPTLSLLTIIGGLLYVSNRFGHICMIAALDTQGIDEFLPPDQPFIRGLFFTLLPIALLGVSRWNLEGRFATGARWIMQGAQMFTGRLLRTAGVLSSGQTSGLADLEQHRILPPRPAANARGDNDDGVVDGSAMSIFLVKSLSLPFMASIFGWLFFGNLPWRSPKKTMCGGLLYLAVKGSAAAYLETCHETRVVGRTVLDYTSV